jgi:hypothetical protein
MGTIIAIVIVGSLIFQALVWYFIRRYLRATDARAERDRERLVHDALDNLDERVAGIIRDGGVLYWAERDQGKVKAEILGFAKPLGPVELRGLVKVLRDRYPRMDIVQHDLTGRTVIDAAEKRGSGQ